jgi:hypothetical protein
MAEGTLIKPTYVAKLTDALTRELPGCAVRTEHVRADRYRFEVVWPPFDEMGHPERQEQVWDIAERALGDELVKVTMILTLGLEDLPRD